MAEPKELRSEKQRNELQQWFSKQTGSIISHTEFSFVERTPLLKSWNTDSWTNKYWENLLKGAQHQTNITKFKALFRPSLIFKNTSILTPASQELLERVNALMHVKRSAKSTKRMNYVLPSTPKILSRDQLINPHVSTKTKHYPY